jgi:hypothetical protein
MMEYARLIISAFGKELDREVAKAIKSLAKSDTIRLSNFYFERLLTIEHPKFDGDEKLKFAFLSLLADFLHQTGYINASPIVVDYVTDPTCPLTETIDKMLATRMVKYSASDVGGEFATIDSLAYWFPEVIRRLALISNERANMTERFFRWVGSIGWKLLKAEPITQIERTAFVMFSTRQVGMPGHIPGYEVSRIVPRETSDPLVAEVAALYAATTLSGPFTNHLKVISDTIAERLTFYVGLHQSELKMLRGTVQYFGPFFTLDMTPQESFTWSVDDQLIGLSSRTSYFTGQRPDAANFAVRIPHIVGQKDSYGRVGVWPDDPSFRLVLTNQSDIADYEYEYHSVSRQRTINSRINNNTLELALADGAARARTIGACQNEKTTLEGFGLMTLTERAKSKLVVIKEKTITAPFLLPSPNGLKEFDIDVTPLGTRHGLIEARPAFSEYATLPLHAFQTPAPQIVEYVSAVYGLTRDESVRFAPVISLYWNCERYERMTGLVAPVDKKRLAKAILTPFNS